jgi:hypothetical protein
VSSHDNHLGRNGFAPKFDGGPILAKILGGTIPPTLWDGVTHYRLPDGTDSTDVVRLSLLDGPVVNLQLKLQGMPVTSANPAVTPNLGSDVSLGAPPPVELPTWMTPNGHHRSHRR